MENDQFIVDKHYILWLCIAMFNNQRVYPNQIPLNPETLLNPY